MYSIWRVLMAYISFCSASSHSLLFALLFCTSSVISSSLQIDHVLFRSESHMFIHIYSQQAVSCVHVHNHSSISNSSSHQKYACDALVVIYALCPSDVTVQLTPLGQGKRGFDLGLICLLCLISPKYMNPVVEAVRAGVARVCSAEFPRRESTRCGSVGHDPMHDDTRV